jgi:hypothetical protein
MKIVHHESFQRMIDESLAGAISAEKEQSLYRGPQRFFLRGKSNPQCQGSGSPQAASHRDNATAQRAIQDLGCICCSTLDVICRIGTRVPDGQATGGPNAF